MAAEVWTGILFSKEEDPIVMPFQYPSKNSCQTSLDSMNEVTKNTIKVVRKTLCKKLHNAADISSESK